ncbi:hypothetical protein Purlil1_7702 [Purpureocillium lilacinum]|uniref:Secreted protein n=1 Tax=Purpureocillium lilacinum TaxID=33203 RepID=A0ABR0BV24_PURLI|nr:hypothetical protein Purlil1_7702 [Purpureocillium lilacinum]
MYKLLLCVLFSLGAAQHVQQNDGPTTEEQQHATRMCNLDNSLRPGKVCADMDRRGGCIVQWKTWDVVDGRISYRTYGKKFACSLPMNLLEARPRGYCPSGTCILRAIRSPSTADCVVENPGYFYVDCSL